MYLVIFFILCFLEILFLEVIYFCNEIFRFELKYVDVLKCIFFLF